MKNSALCFYLKRGWNYFEANVWSNIITIEVCMAARPCSLTPSSMPLLITGPMWVLLLSQVSFISDSELVLQHQVTRLTISSIYFQHISRCNVLMFSESDQYGQTVHKSYNCNISGRQPVTAWYHTIQYFCFGAPSYNPRARNFIQVIWKSTTDLGVGVAIRDNVIWIVAHYRPGMSPCSVRANVPPRLDRPLVWPALCWFENTKVELLMKILLQVLLEMIEYAFA